MGKVQENRITIDLGDDEELVKVAYILRQLGHSKLSNFVRESIREKWHRDSKDGAEFLTKILAKKA
jgi:hypothetical protein